MRRQRREAETTRPVPLHRCLLPPKKLGSLIPRVEAAGISAQAKAELLQRLREKRQQAEDALNLAAGMSLEANAIIPNDGSAAVSPGQKLEVKVKLHNGAVFPIFVKEVALEGFENWAHELTNKKETRIEPGKDFSLSFAVQAPWTAAYTRPYWHRNNPEEDAINTIDDRNMSRFPSHRRPFMFAQTIPARNMFRDRSALRSWFRLPTKNSNRSARWR